MRGVQRSYPRNERVAQLLQAEIAALLPELHALTDMCPVFLPSITEVRLAPDMRQASVQFSLMDGEERSEAVAQCLNREAGHLRQLLGRRLHLRRIPPLHFYYDVRFDRDAAMAGLLSGLKISGEEDPS